MEQKTISRIIVGDISTNCWMYPLSENSADGQKIPPGFRGCALIDPGDESNSIITRLNQLKLVPLYILLTHGHLDHIAAIPALAAEYGRSNGCLVAIHQADAECLGPDSYPVHYRSITAAGGTAAYIDAHWKKMPPPDKTLKEGDGIGPFTVLHLPGHTAGSIGLWDREAKVLFSGDTLFYSDYGRTDLPGGNEAQLFASLKRLFAMDPDTGVFPGHGPSTSIGEEAARGMLPV
ncbi:MAG: MBL fold metallo-hydrolase [Treponema sp.]|nr:MBL fold metallo-hydrolase [Treponema sp.]